MKIGVISDTHSQEVPSQVIKDLKKVDLIIHAGDFCSKEDLDIFTKIKDVKAVYGNMDDSSLTQILPFKNIFECEGIRIGITHGFGPANKVLETAQKVFAQDNVQAVVFGHSHMAMNEKIGGVLYFNPGSPNDVCAAQRSYGMLEVSDGQIMGKIIKIG